MRRVLVSHRWMGENFRDMLARMPYEVRLLFRSVRAVVIASDIRPSYHSAFRGAIYLDPAYVALTPEQRAAITDEQDYRTDFGRDLQFEIPWRFVRENRWMRSHSGPDGSRSLETMMPFIAYLLLHELAHAADYIHPDRIADFFDSERPQDVADNQGSKNLTAAYPSPRRRSTIWRESRFTVTPRPTPRRRSCPQVSPTGSRTTARSTTTPTPRSGRTSPTI